MASTDPQHPSVQHDTHLSGGHQGQYDENDPAYVLQDDQTDPGFNFSRKKCILLTLIACIALGLAVYAVSEASAPDRRNRENRNQGSQFQSGFSRTRLVSADDPSLTKHYGHFMALSRDGLPVITMLSANGYSLRVYKCRNVLCNAYSSVSHNTLQLVQQAEDSDRLTNTQSNVATQPLSSESPFSTPSPSLTPSSVASSPQYAGFIDADGYTSLTDMSSYLASSLSSSSSSSSSPSPLSPRVKVGHIPTSTSPSPTPMTNSLSESLSALAARTPVSRVAIGHDQMPMVVFTTLNNAAVAMHCADPECLTVTSAQVLSTSVARTSPSLVIGPDGLPIIALTDDYSVGNTALRIFHCTDKTCKHSTNIDIRGVKPNAHTRVALIVGADGLPLIAFAGEWKGRALDDPDYLESAHVDETAAATAYSLLTKNGVISELGVVNKDVDINDPGNFVYLYTDVTSESKRRRMLRETMNILRLHQGYIDKDGAPLNPRQLITIHCEDYYCSQGAARIGLPWDASPGVVDVDITIGRSGEPLLAVIVDSSRSPFPQDGSINVTTILCPALDCYASVSRPIGGGRVGATIVQNVNMTSGRISISSGTIGIPLIQFEVKGRTHIARCRDPSCLYPTLYVNSLFDNEAVCDVSPCAIAMLTTVDNLPFIVYGSQPIHAMHCSNPFCVPYMLQ